MKKRQEFFKTLHKKSLGSSAIATPTYNMEEELARSENLKNTAFAQDIVLKRNTLIILFCFLGGETIVIFLFTFLQAIKAIHFSLDEWSFRLVVTATLLQITYMVKIAVQHLFPGKDSKQ